MHKKDESVIKNVQEKLEPFTEQGGGGGAACSVQGKQEKQEMSKKRV